MAPRNPAAPASGQRPLVSCGVEMLPAPFSSRVLRRLMRFLFRWRGVRVIAHTIRRRLYRDAWVWIDDFDGDLRFRCRLDEHIGSFMYWRGAYSWNQLRVLDGLLQDGMVFVDVGANQGEFTLFAAKRLPVGRVIALEPMSEMYARLLQNIEANRFDNVLVRQVGLWSEPTQKTIYRQEQRFVDGSIHEGLGTVFPTEARDTRVEEIECVTLDSLVEANEIARVNVMKLDVEGAELHVLRGAVNTIERDLPTLLIEVDRRCCKAAGVAEEELLDWLERWYRLESILASGRTRPLRRANLKDHQNVLCLPR